jgi:hypothetical protein
MPTIQMRVLLFFSSYFPLFLIIGILVFSKSWIVALVIFVADSVFVYALWRYLRTRKRDNQHSFSKVTGYQQRDSEAMSYIASYIVPFATFSLDAIPQLLALIVFIVMLLILYVNSHMIYVNPMLNIMGYHLYEIEVEHGDRTIYYLARKRLARKEIIHYVSISDDVWLEIKP